jgi:hypothetical protein
MSDSAATTLDRRLAGVLGALCVLDAVLATWALAFPSQWFAAFHGTPYDDPEGLLRRCGAGWAAYTLFQLVAFRRWKDAPVWLAVVAGLRLGEVFTDWAYLGFAQHTTWFGKAALFVASPVNVALGWFLLGEHRRRSGPAKPPG